MQLWQQSTILLVLHIMGVFKSKFAGQRTEKSRLSSLGFRKKHKQEAEDTQRNRDISGELQRAWVCSATIQHFNADISSSVCTAPRCSHVRCAQCFRVRCYVPDNETDRVETPAFYEHIPHPDGTHEHGWVHTACNRCHMNGNSRKFWNSCQHNVTDIRYTRTVTRFA